MSETINFDIKRFSEEIYKKPVILFGAKAIGQVTNTMLKKMGINVQGFADNDIHMQGKQIDEVVVYSPEQIAEYFPDGLIVICRLFGGTQKEIEEQLIGLGYSQIISCLVIWYAAKTKKSLTESFMAVHSRNPLFLPSVEFEVTECCSLRCAECANLSPYFSKPQHYDTALIIEGMKQLAECTGGIGRVVIIGGEPFLHPELGKICKAAAAMDKVISVHIVTNGTIVPSPALLQDLAESLTYIAISDYGELSTQKEALVKALETYQIPYEIRGQGKWWRTFGKPQDFMRTEEENQRIFESCPYRKCLSVLNGEFRLCPRSNFAARLGMPQHEEDRVLLFDKNLSAQEKERKIYQLVNEAKEYFPCSYCMGATGEPILPALQVKNKKVL